MHGRISILDVVLRHGVTVGEFDAVFEVVDFQDFHFDPHVLASLVLGTDPDLCLELDLNFVAREAMVDSFPCQVLVQFFKVVERRARREELSKVILEEGAVLGHLKLLPRLT